MAEKRSKGTKRKQAYTQDDIEKAIEEIHTMAMSTRSVAEKYTIPESTIRHKISEYHPLEGGYKEASVQTDFQFKFHKGTQTEPGQPFVRTKESMCDMILEYNGYRENRLREEYEKIGLQTQQNTIEDTDADMTAVEENATDNMEVTDEDSHIFPSKIVETLYLKEEFLHFTVAKPSSSADPLAIDTKMEVKEEMDIFANENAEVYPPDPSTIELTASNDEIKANGAQLGLMPENTEDLAYGSFSSRTLERLNRVYNSTCYFSFKQRVCLTLLLYRYVKKKRRRKYWIDPLAIERRLTQNFSTIYEELRRNNKEFRSYFRMSISTFDELLSKIKSSIMRTNTQMRYAISPVERLSVTLRYISTGKCFSALRSEFFIGTSTISVVIKNTSTAIWECLKNECLPPPSTEKWREISDKFYKKTNFPNCIGVMDAKQIFNHGNRSTILIALVDSDYYFTAVDVDSYELMDDVDIFRISELGQKFQQNEMNVPPPCLPPNDVIDMPYVMLGNNFHANLKFFLRPYSRKSNGTNKRYFNNRLERPARIAESAFGMFVEKWKTFDQNITVGPELTKCITKACCVLHNFVLKRDGFAFEDTLYESGLEQVYGESTWSTGGYKLRSDFTDYFMSSAGSMPWQFK